MDQTPWKQSLTDQVARLNLLQEKIDYTREFADVSDDFRYMRLGQLYVTLEEAMESLQSLPFEERLQCESNIGILKRQRRHRWQHEPPFKTSTQLQEAESRWYAELGTPHSPKSASDPTAYTSVTTAPIPLLDMKFQAFSEK